MCCCCPLMTQALLSCSSEEAAFEFEMLQHHPGLELLVTTKSELHTSYVTFLLPLFAEKPAWDPSAVSAAEDAWSVYLPDAFQSPNAINSSKETVLSIIYLFNSREKQDPRAWRPFAIALKWPVKLSLSSQVVHAPVASQLLSSVDILTSCQQVRQSMQRCYSALALAAYAGAAYYFHVSL